MTRRSTPAPLKTLVWPMRLTLFGLWAERLARAFWPLWSLLLATVAALAFGVQDFGPLLWVQIAGAVIALAAVALLAVGLRRFRRPTPGDALDRLDATMPGRPIAALTDTQAIGTDDPASLAVWQAHKDRMAKRAAQAQPVRPDLRLSSRDPFSLRYVALTAFVMAVLFGSFWRVTSVAGLAPGAAEAMPSGPTWEGWAQPPAYTGKPTLYLNDITAPTLELPTGSRVQVRLYGAEGSLTVEQTIAAAAPPPAPTAEPAAAVPDGMQGVHDLTVAQSGRLAIEGPSGREWQITAKPDAGPSIAVSGNMGREADGRFKQGFTASDDYGVVAGRVTIALDLAAIDRRHGLTVEPEPVEPVTLDLPMPMTGKRTEMTELLVDDLSKHVFANLPVTMVFAAVDAAGQEGQSAPYAVTLPGKRFFDPLAAALIEMRRDILWNRVNATRAAQILKAVTNKPEGFIRHDRAFLRLRVLMRTLDTEKAALSTEQRDAVAEELWQISLMVEEGNLHSALERLQRAQDRLDEAIRNGASPEEIEQLMREMQQALNEYTRELAEEAQRNPGDQQQSEMMQGQMMSADQLQQMMDELQRLMEEGKTAEAAELMEQLRQLMENMQVVQGQGGQGQGQGSPGQQAMRDLGDTLRDQQELSDDAYRDMQQGEDGQQPGDEQQGQDGQQPGQQPGQGQDGQQGEGQAQDQGSLTDRQRDLRQRLNQLQNGQLPGDGTRQGEAGRQNLDDAARAMEEAEDALRDGDLDGALDRQADALQSLRDGMRDFGEALAQEQRENRDGQGGEEFGRADPNGRDPLGREAGEDSARIGSDQNMVQNDPNRRAQELLDEIRRRSGELTRPGEELDYLKRLLEMF
ncbi:MAG: TIGR02302 family protein [Tabrizicola sp.]|uniref:TIGR02302 family protein n=1 Tax=Tabrizicola sp. TaxID=2005166 RepID=UPI0027373ACE|nr:TIGR02302 family protein [Tabrizicola sp.]MDP3262282.1 TIGR02302 family protein [Tabrizicola sp.]MDP3647971.1 TIGR02302 family protein [Paracoccaceae bacterium]MDZ4068976.1 TIGR02302 family protein [Tabrizicola sp.]